MEPTTTCVTVSKQEKLCDATERCRAALDTMPETPYARWPDDLLNELIHFCTLALEELDNGAS